MFNIETIKKNKGKIACFTAAATGVALISFIAGMITGWIMSKPSDYGEYDDEY